MKRTYRLYLCDILEAINRIQAYVEELTYEEFSRNTQAIDAVTRNFEIIGEATKQIPGKVKKEHSQIQWKQMAGMRDKLAHEYFGVNLEILWKTTKKRLPMLKPQIEKLLKEAEETE